MKNTFKLWLGMWVMALVFGMTVIRCGDGSGELQHGELTVVNTSNVNYWVSVPNPNNGNKPHGWAHLFPADGIGKSDFTYLDWEDDGVITIFYQMEGTNATSWSTRTFNVPYKEKVTVYIP